MKYSNEELEKAVKLCTTWEQVCVMVGAKPRTGSQTYIKKRAQNYITAEEYAQKKYPHSHKLKEKMIRENLLETKCNICGIIEWLKKEVVWELDHIDGNHYNNKFCNLQLLCPNCHSQKTRKDRK